MRARSMLSLLLTLTVGATATACTASSGEDAVVGSESALTERTLTEADDGAMLTITKGTELRVSLAGNASHRDAWVLQSTTNSLGQPETSFVLDPDRVEGSREGRSLFVWKTAGRRPTTQYQTVVIEYGSHVRRGVDGNLVKDPPTKSFSFKVKIDPGDAQAQPDPRGPVVVGQEDFGIVRAVEGQDVVVRLPEPPSEDGAVWTVGSTDRDIDHPGVAREPLEGGGATAVFTWSTRRTAFGSIVGMHEVSLLLKAPNRSPKRTMTYKIEVLAPSEESGFVCPPGHGLEVLCSASRDPAISWCEPDFRSWGSLNCPVTYRDVP